MELQERLSTARPAPTVVGKDPFSDIKNRIHLQVIGDLGPQLFNVNMDPLALRERVTGDIRTHLAEEAGLSRADRERLVAEIADDILGHGPLERLLADDTVTEIMVNGPHDVWIERAGQQHVLRLEARPKNIEGQGEIAIRELVRNSLRMRPDRIIVGEVRGAEALDMLQAMNTGHDGSLTTVHANSPRDALARVETMVLMAGYDLPVRAIRQQVSSALDLIVHLERLEDGSRRVTAITEVQRMESEVITLQEIFAFKLENDTGGTYIETTSIANLKKIYSQLGSNLASEYLLHYRSLAGPDKQINV